MNPAHSITVVTDSHYLRHDTGGGNHPESPARLTVIQQQLAAGPLARQIREEPPRPANREQALFAHSESYLFRLEEAALAGRSFIDHPDNQICFESYEVALLAAGAGLTAIDRLEQGAAAQAFCPVRPPGHHAERGMAMGFCLLNNAVIAARYWQRAHGRTRILIVDWDAHHGNGIQAAVEEDPDVFYASVHEHPTFSFPGTGFAEETGSGPGLGTVLNVPLLPGADDAQLLAALANRIEPVIARFQPAAIIVCAGFDGHQLDDMAGLAFTSAGYHQVGRLMADWGRRFAPGRVLTLLEGGYHLAALAESVEAYLAGLLAVDP